MGEPIVRWRWSSGATVLILIYVLVVAILSAVYFRRTQEDKENEDVPRLSDGTLQTAWILNVITAVLVVITFALVWINV